jgi:transcription antitermination protein NusB
MANRHLARSTVLQALFEWDFCNKKNKEAIAALHRDCDEFAPGMGDPAFMEKLLDGVIAKRKDIDTIIEKAAPDWPIDKISIIDRNILRIGLYELLFAARCEVPAKVAINEAIELAKTYGGDTSGRFVNGVLGAVYKELGEPGKDEVSKKKIKEIPKDKMPLERLGGAIIYAKSGPDIFIALVHDVFGHWTLSKGHIESNEEVEAGTVRGIKEELGLDVALQEKLGENEYIACDPEKGKKRKHVHYFLAESPYVEMTPEKKGGLDDAKWFKLADILELNFYNDILPIVTKAVELILKRTGRSQANQK